MKIAIPVKENKNTESEVFEKFEKATNLALVNLYEDRYNLDIIEKDMDKLSLEEISNFLSENDIKAVIADKIEEDLCKLLSKEKIMVVYEAQGKIENIVGAFAAMLSNQEQGCSGNCNGCGGDHDHEDACCTTDESGCGGCH
ncbi:MAG: NifB/NifX family molybdenum-iron cluster-binding protein [Thermotogota bacterium]